MRATLISPLVGAGLLTLVGCHPAVTEVVVVVDTDLSLPAEADTLEIQIRSPRVNENYVFGGTAAPSDAGAVTSATLPRFPATLGLEPRDDGGYAPFDVTAMLLHRAPGALLPDIVVARKASGVQFVRGQTRTLFISLLRSCVCNGTACPNPTTAPACADLTAPTLPAFDASHLPRVARTDGGAAPDGTPDTGRDVTADAPSTGDGATEARADAPSDGASDHGTEPEAPLDSRAEAREAGPDGPELVATGAACTSSAVCHKDNFCVDGVCCDKSCECGTCAGSTPGTCVPVAAGTDPRAACGLYNCDGSGACTTSCPEAYGSCMSSCKAGSFCDGAGKCSPALAGPGFCVLGTCTCELGRTCQKQEAGAAGVCQ